MNGITEQKTEIKMMAVPLYNLGCGGGRSVLAERMLSREPGVVTAYGNPITSALYIQYDPALTNRTAIEQAVERLGLSAPGGASTLLHP